MDHQRPAKGVVLRIIYLIITLIMLYKWNGNDQGHLPAIEFHFDDNASERTHRGIQLDPAWARARKDSALNSVITRGFICIEIYAFIERSPKTNSHWSQGESILRSTSSNSRNSGCYISHATFVNLRPRLVECIIRDLWFCGESINRGTRLVQFWPRKSITRYLLLLLFLLEINHNNIQINIDLREYSLLFWYL